MKFKTLGIDAFIQSITEARKSRDGSTGLHSRETNILYGYDPTTLKNPFKDLPNVSSMTITTNIKDPLLHHFGIAKRLDSKIEFEKLNSKLNACKRYNRIMFDRLTRLCVANDHEGFWVLAFMLIKKSKTYKLIALRKLQPNWFAESKLWHVWLWLNSLSVLCKLLPTRISAHREYVFSPPPKKRALGVPDKPARMFLYLLQCFFTIYLHSYIGSYQHGFRPGKGTLTAWKEVKKFLGFSNIYEFDLKSAFPSVSIDYTVKALRELGCPIAVCDYISDLHTRTIIDVDREEQKEWDMPEPKVDMQESIRNYMIDALVKAWEDFMIHIADLYDSPNPDGSIDIGPEYERLFTEFINLYKLYRQHRIDSSISDGGSIFTMAAHSKLHSYFNDGEFSAIDDIIESIKKEKTPSRLVEYQPVNEIPIERRGFIEGSGLSPVLFIFAFEVALKRGHFERLYPEMKIVAYADDFLGFSMKVLDNIFEQSKSLIESGLQINIAKSGVIRLKDIWLKARFKFLGLTYEPSTDLLIGTPRKATTELPMDKDHVVELYEQRNRFIEIFNNEFPQLAKPPRQVLQAWGFNEFPYNLIPEGVINGSLPITPTMLEDIKTDMTNHGINLIESTDISAGEISKETIQSTDQKKSSSFPTPLFSIGDLPDGWYETGSRGFVTPHGWVDSRIGGMILSRLYDTKWENSLYDFSTDTFSMLGRMTNGQSWLERTDFSFNDYKVPSMNTVSSYATTHLLNHFNKAPFFRTGKGTIEFGRSLKSATVNTRTFDKDSLRSSLHRGRKKI